jgi:hypothetical protein
MGLRLWYRPILLKRFTERVVHLPLAPPGHIMVCISLKTVLCFGKNMGEMRKKWDSGLGSMAILRWDAL